MQAACWLDIKRVYMELRPVLRRVYMTVCDLLTYAPSAQSLVWFLLIVLMWRLMVSCTIRQCWIWDRDRWMVG